MPYKLVSILLVSLLTTTGVSGLAITKRQSTDSDSYTCGSNNYDADAINAAVSQGYSYLESGDTVGSGSYPHQYKDYEGFDFPTSSPWYEFPILSDGDLYSGGSPGADRVIFDSDGNFDSVITHTGASGNDFVACDDNGSD